MPKTDETAFFVGREALSAKRIYQIHVKNPELERYLEENAEKTNLSQETREILAQRIMTTGANRKFGALGYFLMAALVVAGIFPIAASQSREELLLWLGLYAVIAAIIVYVVIRVKKDRVLERGEAELMTCGQFTAYRVRLDGKAYSSSSNSENIIIRPDNFDDSVSYYAYSGESYFSIYYSEYKSVGENSSLIIVIPHSEGRQILTLINNGEEI